MLSCQDKADCLKYLFRFKLIAPALSNLFSLRAANKNPYHAFFFFHHGYPVHFRKVPAQRRHAARGGGRVDRPPLLFFENRKKVPRFWKNRPNCASTWDESSIQNVILRISRGKSFKIFPCGTFLLLFLTKSLSKCPNSTKPLLP